jgi:hypothetical protein
MKGRKTAAPSSDVWVKTDLSMSAWLVVAFIGMEGKLERSE